jgi:hypothetical protein
MSEGGTENSEIILPDCKVVRFFTAEKCNSDLRLLIFSPILATLNKKCIHSSAG